MYQVSLSNSYFPAQTNLDIEEITVGDVLENAAKRAPDYDALVEVFDDGSTGRRWTYHALLSDSILLGRYLAQHYSPNERLAIWSPNSPEWVIFEFACAYAGLTMVTVNPSFQARELKYVLEQSGSVALFLVDEHRGNPMGDIAKKVAIDLEKLRKTVEIDKLMDLARAAYGSGELEAFLPTVKPEDIAQIQYTSGTTGFPKGALLSHRGLVNNSRHTFVGAGFKEKSRYLTLWPLFHTAGCSASVIGGVQLLFTNYVMPMFIPDAANRIIDEEKIQVTGGVPTMAVAMLESQKRISRDFSSLTYFFGAGSMVPPELSRVVSDAWDLTLTIIYGQTEAHPVITMTRQSDNITDLCETVGQPIEQTEVAIMDTNTHEIMPLDTQGEICCRGYLVMPGYNDNPEATAEAIDENGWLHTGDLGSMDARGYVKISGRVKEMIIKGGENLFPAEIENCLLEHSDVAEIAVVGLPDDKYGEIVAAFIRLNSGLSGDIALLKNHCRAEMSPQKTPSVWIFVDEFPLTGSGKIKRFEMRDRWVAGDYG